MINAAIFNIIIYKLSHWQKFNLIILLKIDQNSKIGLHSDVLPFYFAISLKMKNVKEFLFNII